MDGTSLGGRCPQDEQDEGEHRRVPRPVCDNEVCTMACVLVPDFALDILVRMAQAVGWLVAI